MKYSVGESPEEVTNMIRGLEHLSPGQAETVGVVQSGEGKVPQRLLSTFHCLKGASRAGERLLTWAWSGTRGNCLNCQKGGLDTGKKFFPMRVVKHQMPRDVEDVPSL